MSPETHRSNRTKTVLFICTANYYRSRFSEYLFNALAEQKGLRWKATSCGLQTWMVDGQGAISRFTVERLYERGIDIKGSIRFPIQLAEIDLKNADLVVAVKEAEHHEMMAQQFPAWADRIQYWDVDDLDCATAEEALPVCEAHVEALVGRLLAEQESEVSTLRRAG